MNDTSAEVINTMNTITMDAANSFKSMQSQMSDAAQTSSAQLGAGLEKTQAQLKEQMDKAMKSAEDAAAFSQGTLDAVLKSSQIWANGLQELSKQIAATAQTQLEQTMTTFKTVTGMRSLKDLMDLQASVARATVEAAMSETGRLTDASFKLAEDALAPLTARMSLAMETFSKTD